MGGQLPAKRHFVLLAELLAELREARERPGVPAEERGRYARWIEQLSSFEGLLRRANAPAPLPSTGVDDLSDLPDQLLQQLSIQEPDQLENQILSVIGACGGTADLDQILIGLYRNFGVIQKRRVIQNKLWRMVRTHRLCKARNTRNRFSLETRAARRRGGKGRR